MASNLTPAQQAIVDAAVKACERTEGHDGPHSFSPDNDEAYDAWHMRADNARAELAKPSTALALRAGFLALAAENEKLMAAAREVVAARCDSNGMDDQGRRDRWFAALAKLAGMVGGDE